MAIGNNSNKKKKIIVRTKPDPYLRKEWYSVKAPVMFKKNEIGQTPVFRTSGLRVAQEVIKGRVYDCNLGDLAENEANNGQCKFQFISVETKDQNSLTDFHGYNVTRHKYQAVFRKGCSRIETAVDALTKDGFQLRIFAFGFTDRKQDQKKINCYIKTSEVKKIRKIMSNAITDEIRDQTMQTVLAKLAGQKIDEKMAQAGNKVTTLRDVIVHRVKVVAAPKFDAERISALHTGQPMEFGKKVEAK